MYRMIEPLPQGRFRNAQHHILDLRTHRNVQCLKGRTDDIRQHFVMAVQKGIAGRLVQPILAVKLRIQPPEGLNGLAELGSAILHEVDARGKIV